MSGWISTVISLLIVFVIPAGEEKIGKEPIENLERFACRLGNYASVAVEATSNTWMSPGSEKTCWSSGCGQSKTVQGDQSLYEEDGYKRCKGLAGIFGERPVAGGKNER